ncbi:YaeQ family protein [Oceanobacter mangrovi]|uniref:YaeQ family protein n=1 Tax=Oceanobacter mangrovi TaxID=2862510 RepID=UPI001C8F0DB5|nr:YaeQ family protein [Oceanobacter mangrovi]
MALKATICKASINLADNDRMLYEQLTLTVALHPSETPLRMMSRILAFCLHATEGLTFTRGLSTDNEPDIWRKDDINAITDWIEVGQPTAERLKKASRQAAQVWVYGYSDKNLSSWLSDCQKQLGNIDNIQIAGFQPAAMQQLADLHNRNMDLAVQRDGDDLWITADNQLLHVPIQHFSLNDQ